MKKYIECEVDEDKYHKYNEIVEKSGRNINQTIMMLINKTIKENSIDWLYTSLIGEVQSKSIKAKNAINTFNNRGYKINSYYTTFATKTTNCNYYWLNPDKRHLKQDWYIILNDNIKKKLHLFFVPKNTIAELKMRNDKICNMSIQYNDPDFTEIYLNIPLREYYKETIDYDSLIF